MIEIYLLIALIMDAKVYNQKGVMVDTVKLDKRFFDLPWQADLVHQTIVSMQANHRRRLAVAKDRGAVAGGGKKPWRQKGTGRARHGSIRSPLWIGGGVTHGPTALRDYHQKINKKAGLKTLFVLLSKKFKDGDLILVDKLFLTAPKTKIAKEFLTALAQAVGLAKADFRAGKRTLLVTPVADKALVKSFQNLKNAAVTTALNLNPFDLATYQYAVFLEPEKSLPIIIDRGHKLFKTKARANDSQVKSLVAKSAKAKTKTLIAAK